MGARRAHAASVGSIGAALQTDVKRLLAYSSIAHAGYVLMAFQAGDAARASKPRSSTCSPTRSWSSARSRWSPCCRCRGDDDHSIDGYRGLASRRPVLGSLLVFFMLAQAGIPLTGGFIAKLDVFAAAADADGVRARRDRRRRHRHRRVRVPARRAGGGHHRRRRRARRGRAGAGAEAEGAGSVAVATSTRRVDLGTGVVLFVAAAMTLVLGLVPGVFVDWAGNARFLFCRADRMAQRIEDYALIGDTHTAALVGKDGSIDWLCVPRFDSSGVRGAARHPRPRALAARAGGRHAQRSSARYRGDTLVLETTFHTDEGVVRIVDCMPIRKHTVDVVRIVEGVSGRVPIHMDLRVRFDYGIALPWVRKHDGHTRLDRRPELDVCCARRSRPRAPGCRPSPTSS